MRCHDSRDSPSSRLDLSGSPGAPGSSRPSDAEHGANESGLRSGARTKIHPTERIGYLCGSIDLQIVCVEKILHGRDVVKRTNVNAFGCVCGLCVQLICCSVFVGLFVGMF